MDDLTEINTTLGHIVGMLSRMDERLNRMESRPNGLEAGQAALGERLTRLDQRLNDMPTARDFGAIEGRFDEMSRHLNSALVYVAPPPKRGGQRG